MNEAQSALPFHPGRNGLAGSFTSGLEKWLGSPKVVRISGAFSAK
jgi:hypothetical protein